MLSVKVKVLFLAVVVCSVKAQDFHPDPLESPTSTTSTTTDATTTIEFSTDAPTTSSSISTSTATSPSESTDSNAETTTVPTSTEHPMDTTTTWTTTTVSDTETSTIAHTTAEPYNPNVPTQKCYFRKQQGMLQHFWTCEGPKWGYTMECYYCCQSENGIFAGCNRVDYSYCQYYY